MSSNANKQTLGFQAEVGKVLDLVIHSLYSNKEIFLRELISNASDALDKMRFAAITDKTLYEDDFDGKIKIEFDKEKKLLTIADNGIGMSQQEIIEHLGTIAKSGTKEFFSQLSGDQAKDANLIGQFGVGFYSAFIVADKVTVRSRKAGLPTQQAVQWQSDGVSEYTVEAIEKKGRGTEIILHLRNTAEEFLDDFRLKNIITKYSDHINWPIFMQTEKEVEGEKKFEDEQVNRATALWTLQKNQITEEEYKEFYKHISHDFQDPMTWLHKHVEGKTNYTKLLYLPEKAPFDLWHPEFRHGPKLYVQRVFIMDDADKFLPRYLRFAKGVIDCADLPLNVSREILQDNKTVDSIRAANTKDLLGLLEKLAENDKEKYQTFWNEFGQVLKEGPIEDFANKDTIAKLLRFSSTHTDKPEQTVSLSEYVSRMKPDQKKIYFITAENFNAAKNSPHLEIFRQKNIEVLLLADRVDEWLFNHLHEFDGKHIQSITRGKLDADEIVNDEETQKKIKEAEEKNKDEFAGLLEHAKKILEQKVKEVRLTYRLTHSPACLVADEYDMGRQMQRILQAAGQSMPASKPIFELNPSHPIVLRLKSETDDQRFEDWIKILFDQAVLTDGGELDDPALFVDRLNKMLLELTK